jgi:hypothetical protein
MRKYLSSPRIIFLLAVFLIPFMVSAASISIENPFGANSTIWTILDGILNFLFWLSLPLGALTIVYAAYVLLFSAGEPEKVTKAKQLILYAIIGIIVVFLSKAIILLLMGALGVRAGGTWNGQEQRFE